ncbi:winged helix-turn-helix domain-containing protein [Halovivax gelatinilyticus]|uniref:winged helix-turn-helix domain-containing protein n=1 Tax=Halovivax gelatinilyticus TaxID=2961597 RepID=UPI0020CA4F7E|nr:helix-turn-helix domain-containing protein [Halovivax gelatinilyticus]
MADGDADRSATLDPDDAFAVLANETRFAIVQTLWERYDPNDPAHVVKFADLYESDGSATFSELYDRVGYDDTGNFNYHLEQLTDHFVRRTDSGYELTEAGFEIARAVVAGTVRGHPNIEPQKIGIGCPRCDAPVVIAYENHHLRVSCSECRGLWENADGDTGVLFTFPLPPTGLSDRTPEAAFHATLAYNLNRVRSFILGVCPDCSGVVDESVDICENHEPSERGGCPHCHRAHRIEAVEVCSQCKSTTRGPLTIAILAHPTVTAFFHDNGIEHHFASWETFRRAQRVEETVVDTDPLRFRLTVPAEDDRLHLTLDESLDVVESVQEVSYAPK